MGDPSTTRPAPAASGTLAKTPFIHLMLYALEKKLGGTVELLAPDKRTAVVLFVDGQPAKARTSEAVAYLGQVLRELGHLTEEQLTRSLAELATSKAQRPTLHGELLVDRRLINGDTLRDGLTDQLARKLRYIAAMPIDTTFAYYDGFDGLQGWGAPETRSLDPVPLLWEMLREYAPWEHVQAALARVTASPLRLARGADILRMRLGKDEAAAAELLRTRPTRASELGKAAHLNERTAQLLAYLLLVTKQVDVLPPLDSVPGAIEPNATPVTSSVSSPFAEPSVTMTAPKRATRSSHARKAASVLLAPPASLSVESAGRWNEIVARAAAIDRADYFMILDVARDAKVDEVRAAYFALAKQWHPDRLSPELSPVRDACSRVFSRMSEAHATLSDAEQRSRYMKLLADGSGTPEMQETVARVVEAATDFQKAEVFFRKNDLIQAEIFCRKALEADSTQAAYLALLAWLVAIKPENQNPEKTAHCIQMLDRAIALNGRSEKGHFWRGMLYKKIGRIDVAIRDFKRAVEINPRNIDAAREVRLFLMRGGRTSSSPPFTKPVNQTAAKPDDARKPHLLSRLFKKT